MCTYFTLFAVCSMFFWAQYPLLCLKFVFWIKSFLSAWKPTSLWLSIAIISYDIVISLFCSSFLSSSNQPNAFLLTPMNFIHTNVKHMSWDLFEWLLYNVHCIVDFFPLCLLLSYRTEEVGGKLEKVKKDI